jgi:hypothetical protein
MTDPLAVETGDRAVFPAVLLIAGDTGLKYLVNEQVAVPPFLVPGPRAGVTSMDRYSPLRERMISLRRSRLVLLGALWPHW